MRRIGLDRRARRPWTSPATPGRWSGEFLDQGSWTSPALVRPVVQAVAGSKTCWSRDWSTRADQWARSGFLDRALVRLGLGFVHGVGPLIDAAPVADWLGPGPGGPADLAGPRRAGPETRFDPSMLDQRSGGSRCARPAAGEPRRSRCRTGRSWPRNRMVANASVRRVMRLASRGWLRGVSPPSDLQIVASSDSAMPARRTEAARQPACILAVSPSEYVGRAQAA
jgi:hypothetical protein